MLRYCLSCVALTAGLAVPAQAQVKLEWNFKEGETFDVETVTKFKTKQSPRGGAEPVEFEKTETVVARYKVVKKTADGAVLEMRFVRKKIDDVELPTKEAEDWLGAFFVVLKSVTFRVTLGPTGQVTKFEGDDEYIKKVSGNNEGMAKELRAAGLAGVFKEGVVQTFGFLPDKPVRKGDTWKQKGRQTLSLYGSLNGETEYAYQGPNEKGQRIAFTRTFTYELPKPAEDSPVKVIKADVKVEPSKGHILFDANSGRLIRLEETSHLKGTFTLEVRGKEEKTELEQTVTVTIRLLNENSPK